jgi:hypothetical protein
MNYKEGVLVNDSDRAKEVFGSGVVIHLGFRELKNDLL